MKPRRSKSVLSVSLMILPLVELRRTAILITLQFASRLRRNWWQSGMLNENSEQGNIFQRYVTAPKQ